MWAEFDLLPGYDGETIIRDLYMNVSDEWAGAEYRQEVAAVLLSRCLQKLGTDSNTEEES